MCDFVFCEATSSYKEEIARSIKNIIYFLDYPEYESLAKIKKDFQQNGKIVDTNDNNGKFEFGAIGSEAHWYRSENPTASSDDQICEFCKNNHKPESLYRSHRTRDMNGKVSCAVLQKFKCILCGATSTDAHSIKYCHKKSTATTQQSIEIQKLKNLQQMVNTEESSKNQICVFCKNNRKPESFYRSHRTHDDNGKVSCPVLQQFKCPSCGATGERAHTIKYCSKKPRVTMQDSIEMGKVKNLTIIPFK